MSVVEHQLLAVQDRNCAVLFNEIDNAVLSLERACEYRDLIQTTFYNDNITITHYNILYAELSKKWPIMPANNN